jgi:hypothetical protein
VNQALEPGHATEVRECQRGMRRLRGARHGDVLRLLAHELERQGFDHADTLGRAVDEVDEPWQTLALLEGKAWRDPIAIELRRFDNRVFRFARGQRWQSEPLAEQIRDCRGHFFERSEVLFAQTDDDLRIRSAVARGFHSGRSVAALR